MLGLFSYYFSSMNILDLLLIIPLVYAGYKGFRKGFIVELFTFLALFVGIYAGIHLTDAVTRWMKTSLGWESSLLPALAFTILFLGLGAMIYFAGKAIEQALRMAQLSTLNKSAGAVFGAVKMAFFLSMALLILSAFDDDQQFVTAEEKESSLLFHPIAGLTTTVIPGMKETILLNANTSTSEDDAPSK